MRTVIQSIWAKEVPRIRSTEQSKSRAAEEQKRSLTTSGRDIIMRVTGMDEKVISGDFVPGKNWMKNVSAHTSLKH